MRTCPGSMTWSHGFATLLSASTARALWLSALAVRCGLFTCRLSFPKNSSVQLCGTIPMILSYSGTKDPMCLHTHCLTALNTAQKHASLCRVWRPACPQYLQRLQDKGSSQFSQLISTLGSATVPWNHWMRGVGCAGVGSSAWGQGGPEPLTALCAYRFVLPNPPQFQNVWARQQARPSGIFRRTITFACRIAVRI